MGKDREAGRVGSGQTFGQQSRVGSGQRFAGSGPRKVTGVVDNSDYIDGHDIIDDYDMDYHDGHNNIIIDDHDIDGHDIIDDHDIDGYDIGNHSINVYSRIFVSESLEHSFLEAVSMATFKLCIAATLLRRLLYIMFAEIGREKLRPRWRRDCLNVSDNNSCLDEVSYRDP